jgi:ribosomal protein S27E
LATESLQRSYRAPCPGCGVPVEFRSAQSTHAVCGYCQSTVVRSGDTLARTGKMSELFEDFSPLQLMASGKWEGKPFTLIGRLQYKYAQGTWSEWVAGFDDGTTGSLSEDNGAFVFSTPFTSKNTVPTAVQFEVGHATAINGKSFTIAANHSVFLISAQGELPKLPPLNAAFNMVELRGDQGDVISIDYGSEPPALSTGRAVLLEDLQLKGLKDEQAKAESGQQFACPNCAASLHITLASTKSLTCTSCNSIIDVSQGVAGQLSHALQTEPVAPLIALGSTGQIQGVMWQLVGFQHRMGYEVDDPDEHFGWTEYLLYNKKRGFTFLVDSTEGWSLATPTTGAPALSSNGSTATYLGNKYTQKYSYKAETTYVAGEFYWRVERGQKSNNTDFERGAVLLSREETPNEVTWSMGSKLSSAAVAKSFNLKEGTLDGAADGGNVFKAADAKPISSIAGVGCGTIVILVIILLFFLFLISRCSSCDPKVENCSSSRGGSYGGFSSGGGHK